MNVKDHYDNHLGNFYSWMMGDFEAKQKEQETFFYENGIGPASNIVAIDLGAGHGLQSIALARLGFLVKAVDFNKQLLHELEQRIRDLPIEVIEDDILNFLKNFRGQAQVITCMGDTITHLESLNQIEILVEEASSRLEPAGKIILSFRDLTVELKQEDRFIPVKSDEQKILTCFLEYFPEYVVVHDILHEKQNQKWIQKVSAYPKLRVNQHTMIKIFQKNKINVVCSKEINRMIYLIGEKA